MCPSRRAGAGEALPTVHPYEERGKSVQPRAPEMLGNGMWQEPRWWSGQADLAEHGGRKRNRIHGHMGLFVQIISGKPQELGEVLGG